MIWAIICLSIIILSLIFCVFSLQEGQFSVSKWWHWFVGAPAIIVLYPTFLLVEVWRKSREVGH